MSNSIIETLRFKGYKYIGHHTTLKNLDGILKTGKIMTAYERWKHHVVARGIYSYCDLNFKKPFRIGGDVEGVYCHLVYDLNKIKLKNDEVLLLFPLDLMLQKNWHFNLCDHNGYFYPDTYTPETVHLIPDIYDVLGFYKSYIGNEVVFHDGIPIHNCCKVYNGKDVLDSKDYKINYNLKLDKKIGFYLHYADILYTGMEIEQYNKVDPDKWYSEWFRKHLPEEYLYLFDGLESRKEITNRMADIKVDGKDLLTHLYLKSKPDY